MKTRSTPSIPPRRPRVVTPQPQVYQSLATYWNALSGLEKSSWQRLSGQIVKRGANGSRGKSNAYATFIRLNSCLQAAGLPPQPVALDASVLPLPLSGLRLDASLPPTGLRLPVVCAVPYPAPVLLYGLPPRLAGLAYNGKGQFKLLGSVPALTDGDDLAAHYLTCFRVPSPGYEIILKLVGITPAGFQTAAQIITSVASAPPG